MTKIEKAEPMTAERLRTVLRTIESDVTPEWFDRLEADANLDPEENVDWLPYYKAQGVMLAGVVGGLAGLVEKCIDQLPMGKRRTLLTSALRAFMAEFAASTVLAGVGPQTDPAVLERCEKEMQQILAVSHP